MHSAMYAVDQQINNQTVYRWPWPMTWPCVCNLLDLLCSFIDVFATKLLTLDSETLKTNKHQEI